MKEKFLKIINPNPVKGQPSEYVNIRHIVSIEPTEYDTDKYHSMIITSANGVFTDARDPDAIYALITTTTQ